MISNSYQLGRWHCLLLILKCLLFDLPEGGEVVIEPVSMEVLSKDALSESASSLAETMRSLAPRPPLPPPPPPPEEEEDGGQGGGAAAASKAAEKAETESSVFSLEEAPSSERGLELIK